MSAAFPPSSAVGALRWEKFAAFLHDQGIALDVLTMSAEEAESADLSRLGNLPHSTTVIGVNSMRSVGLRTVLGLHRIRSHLAARRLEPSLPDSANTPGKSSVNVIRPEDLPRFPTNRREWKRAYVGRLSRSMEKAWLRGVLQWMSRNSDEHYDIVISSGPPNLCHVAAAYMASSKGLPLVMDMRDPWGTAVALPPEVASPFEVRYAKRMEAYSASRAAAVLVNTPRARELFIASHPGLSSRCHVVMNGVDTDVEHRTTLRPERFVIAFAGSIYFDRNPRLVFRAAKEVISTLGLSSAQFGFEFIGSVDSYGGTSTREIASEEGVENYLSLKPFMPRAKLLESLYSASMLLSLPQDIETSIPAKIFEYMAFPAWMLVLADKDSATGSLLENTAADVVAPTDVDGMVRAITRRFEEFRAGVTPEPVADSGEFSRASQAQRLVSILHDVRRVRQAPKRQYYRFLTKRIIASALCFIVAAMMAP